MEIFSIRMKCTITLFQDQGKKNQDRYQDFGENKLKKKKRTVVKMASLEAARYQPPKGLLHYPIQVTGSGKA